MTLCADSAFPAGLKPFPRGFKAAQFYIGERTPILTPTPHIWTKDDVNGLPKGIGKYPMFVGTPAIGKTGDAVTEAMECLEALYQIGCPLNRIVGLDMETAVNGAYVRTFGQVVNHYKMYVLVYGSAGTVFANPPLNGYDVAHWTGQDHHYPHAQEHATQWANARQLGTSYDARSIRWWTYRHRIWH